MGKFKIRNIAPVSVFTRYFLRNNQPRAYTECRRKQHESRDDIREPVHLTGALDADQYKIEIPYNASMHTIGGFSAYADYDELLA